MYMFRNTKTTANPLHEIARQSTLEFCRRIWEEKNKQNKNDTRIRIGIIKKSYNDL
jgi:hypothetical protein